VNKSMKLFLVTILLTSTALAADLQKQLNKMAAHFHGKVGLYAINMKTGDTVALDADQPVPTASVIKLCPSWWKLSPRWRQGGAAWKTSWC
jgi:beta-lactamase class A